MNKSKFRLFFALIPDPGTRHQICDVVRDSEMPQVQQIRPENLHLTLVYIGGADGPLKDMLVRSAGSVRAERFTLVIDHSGYWKRSGIAWLGPARTPVNLLTLVGRIRALVEGCGIKTDNRSYRPHVTVSRKADRGITFRFRPISWRPERFCLVNSETRPEGAEYSIIKSWPLT